ncbi:MAG TPA: phosphoribosyl-ATP diphosphatase [Planctomycetota bacterium]|nr:phosphoribosyl-ATP diphosphatase [Planctomycetota bacterium]
MRLGAMAAGGDGRILTRLEEVIRERRTAVPAPGAKPSYTRSLFDKGLPKIGAKIREEAGETVEAGAEVEAAGADAAAVEKARAHLVAEVADLVFHTMVLMGKFNVPIEDVYRELERRFGTSGIDEKNARSQNQPQKK